MVRSSRSSKATRVRSRHFRRGEALWTGRVLWAAVFFSAIITLSWFVQTAEADEIEPDSAYEPEPEPDSEPEPAPDPPPPAAAEQEPRSPTGFPPSRSDWRPSTTT